MKKTISNLFMTLGAILFLSACQTIEMDVQDSNATGLQKELREVIITADISESKNASEESGTATRTVLIPSGSDLKTHWSVGDRIKVFSLGESTMFTSTNTEPSRKAQFRGQVSMVVGDDGESGINYLWGLYPYREDATYSEPDGEGQSATAVLTTTVPSLQRGKADSFDDDLATMIGRSESLTISYKNAYSGVYVRFNKEDVISVTVRGLHNEVLAGRATFGLDSNGNPMVVGEVSNPERSVTVYAPDGGTFEKGKNYYMLTLPDVALEEGYSLTVKRQGGLEATFNSLPNVNSLARNVFKTFNNPLDTYIENTSNISSGRSTGWISASSEEPALNEILYLTSDNSLASYTTDASTGNEFVSGGFKRVGDVFYRVFRFAGPVTEIDASAFEGEGRLTEVILPSSVTTIKENAFKDCSNLTSITLSDNLKVIKDRAFFDCGLTGFVLPQGLETIGDQAFAVCSSLKYVFLPSSVSEIGSGVFESSSYIEEFAGAYAYDERHLIKDGRLIAFAAGDIGDNYTEIVPEGVTFIDRGAYAGSTMTGIVLPETLVEIGTYALAQCFHLKNLTIPESVTKIHDLAFDECEGLEWVKIKRTESMIEAVPDSDGDWFAFSSTEDCPIYVPSNAIFWYTYGQHWDEFGYKLGEYNRYKISPADNEIMYTTTDGHAVVLSGSIASTVTVIAPEDNGGIGVIRASSDWTSIPSGMFDTFENPGTANLKTVTIPDKVMTIGSEAFFFCENLESVTFGNSVSTIAANAFFKCGLKTLKIPESVTYIASGAFGTNVSLTTVELPASLTSIVSNPFRHCKSLTRFTGDNPYISDEGNYLSTSEGRLFSYACASTTGEFVIPESITTIGDYAMSSASFSSVKMMSLTPPTLGSYAFDGIDEFDIMIPDVAFSDYQAAPGWSDTDVKSHFKYYQSTRSIWYTTTDGAPIQDPTILPSACTLARNIYLAGQGMLWFSNEVTDIPAEMFRANSTLETVSLPDNLRTIGANAFLQVLTLKEVSLGANLVTIGASAFSGCGLSSIELPDKLTTIGDNAFRANKFVTVSLPQSVTTIGSNPFSEVYTLESFTGGSPLISPDGHCLIHNGVLQSFTTVGVTGNYRVPSGVRSIGSETMRKAIFTTVNFPSTLQTIGAQALRQCENLSTLVIPASVTSIGAYSIDSCPALDTITMESETPPQITSTSFRNLPADCIIFIPSSGYSAYSSASNWANLISQFQVY